MAPNPTEGIQTLPDMIRATVGSLASDTAIILWTVYATALKRDFLLKKLRVRLKMEFGNTDDPVLFGFARGDMDIGSIGSVLANATPDPEDFGSWDEFALRNGIFWETLQLMNGPNGDASALLLPAPIWNDSITIGGGKGIPLEAEHGIQLFAFNPSNGNITNSSTNITGAIQLVGVFMEGSN